MALNDKYLQKVSQPLQVLLVAIFRCLKSDQAYRSLILTLELSDTEIRCDISKLFVYFGLDFVFWLGSIGFVGQGVDNSIGQVQLLYVL